MPTVVERLNTDHTNMARLLDLLDRQLDIVEQAGRADFELMSDIMQYMVRYSDATHHPMEDLLYARLADRSPKARKDLIRIPEQHDAIEAQGRKLFEALSMIADGGMTLRSGILASGRAYVANLRTHIEMEERHLFPMAESILDDQDMAEVQQIFAENQDPVFGEAVNEDFRDLLRHIQEQA